MNRILLDNKKFNYFIAGIHREKASKTLIHSQRLELKKRIRSLQNGASYSVTISLSSVINSNNTQ